MGRPKRAADGGLIYHVLNRANARMPIFEKEGDYEAFEAVLQEAVERTETRLLAYCLLANHWHLIVWPREDGELSKFTGWLTLTHTQRWHAHRGTTGSGHLYQGRFKSFPVQDDDHYYTVCRYAERNALRAGLVERAEDWRWGSLYRWRREARRKGHCWLPGRCPGDPPGSNTSTNRKRRRNWRRCGVAYSVDARSERKPGAIAWCADWSSRARSAPGGAPKQAITVPDTFSLLTPFHSGSLSTVDPDPDDTHTYELVQGGPFLQSFAPTFATSPFRVGED